MNLVTIERKKETDLLADNELAERIIESEDVIAKSQEID